MNERIPPSDIQTERCLLAGMARNEVIFNKAVSMLIKDNFYYEIHREIFAELSKQAKPDLFSLEKICSKLKDDSFFEISESYGSVNGDQEIEIIIECYRRREIIKAAQNAIEASYVDSEQKAIDISSKLFSDACSICGATEDDICSIGSMLPGEFERIESVVKSGSAAFIKTGIPAVDEKLIITQHDYVVLGGRPSNGKSTLSGLIARNVAKAGGRVLIFYLDTPKEIEVSRALFTEAKCSLYDFNRGMMLKRDLPKLSFAAGFFAKSEIYMSSTEVTAEQIVAKAHRLKSEKGPLSLIVIDYLTRVLCNSYRTVRENTNHISSALKGLPKKIGCPVMVLSQLNRYENEEYIAPTRKNLKESGNIEQDADVLLFVHWPGNYPSFDSDKAGFSDSFFKLFVSKQKNGPVGMVPLKILKNSMEIVSIENNRDDENYAGTWQDDI